MVQIEEISDRELLRSLAKSVEEYDRRRDDELEFLSNHPNRDMWDENEEAEHKQICADIHEMYGELSKTLHHVLRCHPHTVEDVRVGDTVHWADPDADICSDDLLVTAAPGEDDDSITLALEDGSHVGALPHEIIVVKECELP